MTRQAPPPCSSDALRACTLHTPRSTFSWKAHQKVCWVMTSCRLHKQKNINSTPLQPYRQPRTNSTSSCTLTCPRTCPSLGVPYESRHANSSTRWTHSSQSKSRRRALVQWTLPSSGVTCSLTRRDVTLPMPPRLPRTKTRPSSTSSTFSGCAGRSRTEFLRSARGLAPRRRELGEDLPPHACVQAASRHFE